jgi:hypothetical protein
VWVIGKIVQFLGDLSSVISDKYSVNLVIKKYLKINGSISTFSGWIPPLIWVVLRP